MNYLILNIQKNGQLKILKKNKNIIYHPVKDFDNHDNYRIILENY